MKPPPWLIGSVVASGLGFELECVKFAWRFFDFRFCCHAMVEQRRESDFPVPVGDSSSAWQFPSLWDRSRVEITLFMKASCVPYGWYGNSTGMPPMWSIFLEDFRLGLGFIDCWVGEEVESDIFPQIVCILDFLCSEFDVWGELFGGTFWGFGGRFFPSNFDPHKWNSISF